MACSFTGTQDETGFIMVHVDINQHSPALLGACQEVLEDQKQDRNPVISLQRVAEILAEMNTSRKKMWEASRWEHYNDFRVFIMGIQGNHKIFPDGVVYEPETTPRYYRGQSGSQDTIIPFLDTFFRICDYYPTNDLTEYLLDMRKYRPRPFRDFLDNVEPITQNLIPWITKFEDAIPALCTIYKEIYDFRNGHWHFVQKYIMANTKYPVATGGTPMVSWLPNQIRATLHAMRVVLDPHPPTFSSWMVYHTMTKELSSQEKTIRDLYSTTTTTTTTSTNV